MGVLLNLYSDKTLVGELKLGNQRKFEFQYTTSWLENPKAYPLSVRLPLRTNIYLDEIARPFFENLLPEFAIRELIAKQFGISEKNIFGILESIGGECAGAFSLFPPDQTPMQSGDYELLSTTALENLVTELPKHPLMADKHLRLSLAGVQHKLPVYIKDNQYYLPRGSNPSSHIIKPPILQFPNTVINEFFCMKLANEMGLPVPKVFLYKGKKPLYIIQRFDRVLDSEGHLMRIHQEDFCQALGILSEQKYESEGGPSLQKCYDLVKTYSIHTAKDLILLLQWVIFNFLIGNSDAHGKNLAFMITNQGPQLAPFYDILCTQIYSELSERYAMKIGGENRPAWIQRRHWERLSESLNVKFKLVLITMKALIEKYYIAVPKLKQELAFLEENEQKTIFSILAITKKRVNQLEALIV